MSKENMNQIELGKYPVIPSAELLDVMAKQIEPELREIGKAFSVKMKDGHRIGGMTFRVKNPKGTIMISHGFSEAWEKYMEMIHYFLKEGYDVCVHDHRGHGSSREEEPGGPTHIDRFQTYVDDFDVVVKKVLPRMTAPYFVYAHSMGGLIAALYVQQHPDVFAKAIFTSPCFEVNRGGLPFPVVYAIGTVACLCGKGKKYFLNQGGFSPVENFEESAASCKERYLMHFRRQQKQRHLQSGGSSCRWAYETLKAGKKLENKKNYAKMELPIMVFQAEHDTYVLPEGQNKLIAAVPNGQLVFVPGSKHEIYLSDDATMQNYLQTIFNFLA